ncbi:Phosphatidylinositol/phosphatidylcholine transfer protein [Thalictrum thalictroides]|uniref:Phosphatidylinositol/phosphatidylcholine transfer protein n=1 Tax=Thalictrum thalictroides TaxID=46969 RepID=A0A7J6WP57_THATH|nr:Phosphatidylinositol/phosphatidylcholine transfer protein [Thalictrum thalictroides]
MPHLKGNYDDITVIGVDDGEQSLNFYKPPSERGRTNSLDLPLEDSWHFPQEKNNCFSFSKLSFKSIISTAFKFHDSMKRTGSSKSMQINQEGPLHLKDEELVESFRRMLLQDGELPVRHNDYHTLLRFLRMRAFDLMKAREMYLKMLKWREDFGVDAISKEFKFEECTEVKRCYPHGFHGVDRYGRPLYIERIGMVDLSRLLQVTTIDRFVKYHIVEQEKTLNLRYPACSIAAKKHVASITSILDVKGVSMHNFSKPARELFMEIQKIDSNNYPETLHRLFIVNAGSGFRVLWKALKAFLEPRTLAKIQVYGSNFQDNLCEIIDPSTLPTFLGGYCTCSEFGGCLLNDKGPWNDPEIIELLQTVCEMEPNFRSEANGNMTTEDVMVSNQDPRKTPSRVKVNAVQHDLETSNSRESQGPEQHRQPRYVDDIVSQKFKALGAGLGNVKTILAGLLTKQEDLIRQMEELKGLTLSVSSSKPQFIG